MHIRVFVHAVCPANCDPFNFVSSIWDNAGVCISVLMWEHGIFDVAKFSTLMPLSLLLSCELCSELLVLKCLSLHSFVFLTAFCGGT